MSRRSSRAPRTLPGRPLNPRLRRPSGGSLPRRKQSGQHRAEGPSRLRTATAPVLRRVSVLGVLGGVSLATVAAVNGTLQMPGRADRAPTAASGLQPELEPPASLGATLVLQDSADRQSAALRRARDGRAAAQREARAARLEAARRAAAARQARLERERDRARERAVRNAARDPRAIARIMVAERGWGSGQFGCLDALWQRESGWNHRAMNPSSGAYGIPQSLPGGKMAAAGADWQTNPVTQVRWGMGYIAERYGSPCGAWAHSEAHNWY